ncbi:hypothetical protein BSN85_12175 [Bradyrhizobium brasilense]|nr:hypothetical protein BSN85_12175 [Bradyrhizobium brasilense]
MIHTAFVELGSKDSSCPPFKNSIPKSLINSDQLPSATGRCVMRNHDFVSDGFLALIATCLVLLCSGLLVVAFS